MSRTRRKCPGVAYMRRPRGKRGALRQVAAAAECTRHANRHAIPADAWDDLVVSEFRGQPWHRAWRDWYKAPLGAPLPECGRE